MHMTLQFLVRTKVFKQGRGAVLLGGWLGGRLEGLLWPYGMLYPLVRYKGTARLSDCLVLQGAGASGRDSSRVLSIYYQTELKLNISLIKISSLPSCHDPTCHPLVYLGQRHCNF